LLHGNFLRAAWLAEGVGPSWPVVTAGSCQEAYHVVNQPVCVGWGSSLFFWVVDSCIRVFLPRYISCKVPLRFACLFNDKYNGARRPPSNLLYRFFEIELK
jgi:hypothetical protein